MAGSDRDPGPGPANYSLGMGWVCHDPLLDSRHWHADVPDFSVCLQKTILIWVPCGFLWLCAPFLIYNRLKSKQVQIPHTLLNTSHGMKHSLVRLLSGIGLASVGSVTHTS